MSCVGSSAERDRRYLLRALQLARRGRGLTNPNPSVGCVVVRGERVVGEGWSAPAGGPHAEVQALAQAGASARGAELFVTLEPCSHEGRTPPCAPAVARAGVARAVVAMRDPNPLVSGRGLRFLRAAGVQVELGLLGREARLQNEAFVVAAPLDRPFVLLKAAVTLDGRIATAAGHSRWITSAPQRRQARALRGQFDGVVVGIGTALLDDPLLLPSPRPGRRFHRIVFDSGLRLPTASRLVRSATQGHPVTIVCRTADARRRRLLERCGPTVLCQADDPRARRSPDGRVSVPWALRALRREGLWSLMVEGGGELLGAFLAERSFDRLALFRAPLLLGGRGSRPAFGGPDPQRIDQALRLTSRSPLAGARGEPSVPELLDEAPLFETWYPLSRRGSGPARP